jgi:glycosyltransferase involved in cell wall biosynthesis
MSKISAIIIAKNEENMIADCLDSVSFCDEIIIVDGGSEDRTVELAKRMGAKVYPLETNDFSKLRNFGLEKAKGDWVLYVDTDERVSDGLKDEIKHLTKDSDRVGKLNAYSLKRKNFYLGTSAKNEWPYIEKLERLFKKENLKGWKGELHESPIIHGTIGELDGYLLHYTHRDLTLMLNKTIEWSKIEAELRFKAGHPQMVWWRFLRVMFTAFFDWYIRQKGYKLGTVGLIESIYQMFSMFITYARLWEMQQIKNK